MRSMLVHLLTAMYKPHSEGKSEIGEVGRLVITYPRTTYSFVVAFA